MTIVFICNWYSENMGYIENCLPKSLAKMGHNVHVLTSQGQVYFNKPYYESSYAAFLGPAIQPTGTKLIDGVKVCRLPYYSIKRRIILKGLSKKIREIKPDIVHTFEHSDINNFALIFTKIFTPFKLFTANHTSALALEVSRKENDGFGWKKRVLDYVVFTLPGIFISFFINKCFCVTTDAGDVAIQYYGVQHRKISVTTLGVDTDAFKPDVQTKQLMRQSLGFLPDDIVCIYSGKLSTLKNPLLLSQAINEMGTPQYKALFIGDGEQQEAILALKNSKIIPFQQHKDLHKYYQLADIAVWPFGESSSQLDAVATGHCLVMSEGVQTYNSVESDTNFTKTAAYRPKIVSRFYKTHDLADLVRALESLRDTQERDRLQTLGMKEVRDIFSWDAIAQRRLEDYAG
jgi:glycosyltransferase involved in cell wall biosynthesis